MPQFFHFIAAEFRQWPTKERMAQILREAGLRITTGRYSVSVEGDARILFEEYGGDLGDPTVDAHADSAAQLLNAIGKISDALSRAKVVHAFTVYDEHDSVIGYFHYEWPRKAAG
jgi:hypothetical protein